MFFNFHKILLYLQVFQYLNIRFSINLHFIIDSKFTFQEIEVVQQDIVVEVEDEPKPAAADNKHEKDDHNGDESRDSVGLKSSLKSLKQSFRRLVKPVVTKRKESKEERNIPKEDSKNVENSINITNIKDNKDSHAGEGCSSNRRMRTISIHYADEMCDHQEVTEVQVLQEDVIIEDNCEQKDEGEVNDKQEKQSPWKKIFNSSRLNFYLRFYQNKKK